MLANNVNGLGAQLVRQTLSAVCIPFVYLTARVLSPASALILYFVIVLSIKNIKFERKCSLDRTPYKTFRNKVMFAYISQRWNMVFIILKWIIQLRVDVTRFFSWRLLLMKTRLCYYIIKKRQVCAKFSSKHNYVDLYRTKMNIETLFWVLK